MEPRNLNIQFSIREDLPSERAKQYRELVIRGLKALQCEGNLDGDEHEMIDRMFRDHYDGETLQYVITRRTVVRKIEAMASEENPDHEAISKLEKLDTALSELIGD